MLSKLEQIKVYTDYNIKICKEQIRNNDRDNYNIEALLHVFEEINKMIEE